MLQRNDKFAPSLQISTDENLNLGRLGLVSSILLLLLYLEVSHGLLKETLQSLVKYCFECMEQQKRTIHSTGNHLYPSVMMTPINQPQT